MAFAPLQQAFDCLRCGRVSTLTEPPLRCRACGHGSGVIRPLEARDNETLLQAPTRSGTTRSDPKTP